MKTSAPLSTEITTVNKETEVIDLKRLREARGLTLKDIFSVTRITVNNLEAIETGQYHLLPAPVYVRTFIKTYAGILETDSRPLLQQYENYLKSLDKTHEVPEEDKRELPRKEKMTRHIHFIPWVIAAIVLSGLIVFIVLVDVNDVMELFSPRPPGSQKIVSPPPAPPQNVPVTAPPVAPTPAIATPAGQSPVSPTPASPAPVIPFATVQKQEQPLNLKIEAVEKTWIRISTDRKQPEQLMLNKGDRIERTARESFIMDVGNAGGILVSFQDKPLPSLGKRGDVRHLKLP